MKTIGFVDYYISEWHADNYPGWIKETCEKMGLEYEVKYAWAKKDLSEYNGKTTDEWCNEFKIEKCLTTKELCERATILLFLLRLILNSIYLWLKKLSRTHKASVFI